MIYTYIMNPIDTYISKCNLWYNMTCVQCTQFVDLDRLDTLTEKDASPIY